MDDCIKTCPHCGAAFSVNDLVYSEEIQPIGVCLDPETWCSKTSPKIA
jgi:hypothetical protein